jgi:hypothetical protein
MRGLLRVFVLATLASSCDKSTPTSDVRSIKHVERDPSSASDASQLDAPTDASVVRDASAIAQEDDEHEASSDAIADDGGVAAEIAEADASESSEGGESAQEPTGCLMNQDGTRLHWRGNRGEDRSFVGVDWFDTEVGCRCYFATAADGIERCLPLLNQALSTTYLDSECTERITYDARSTCTRNSGNSFRFFIETATVDGDQECGASTHNEAYELGRSLGALETTYALSSDGSCTPIEWTGVDPPVEFYEIGDPVPPEYFVGVERAEAVGDRLQYLRKEMSDGSVDHYLTYLFDSTMRTRCWPSLAVDGELRCLPVEFVGTRYADSACSELVSSNYGAAPCPPTRDPFGPIKYYPVHRLSGCGFDRPMSVYEMGDPDELVALETTYRWSDQEDACVESNSAEVLPVGPEVPPESFVAGTTQPRQCGPGMLGGTRLSTVSAVWQDGSVAASRFFFDPELGEYCSPLPAADGATRCVPQAYTYAVGEFQTYADAECTVPTAYYACPTNTVDPFEGRGYATLQVDHGGCEGIRIHVHPLTGPELDTAYELDADGQCARFDNEAGWIFRAVGPEIPPANFVAFEIE